VSQPNSTDDGVAALVANWAVFGRMDYQSGLRGFRPSGVKPPGSIEMSCATTSSTSPKASESCLRRRRGDGFGNVPFFGTWHIALGHPAAVPQHSGRLRPASRADRIASLGIDSWGLDYGLLDDDGELLGNPVHYRDARTEDIIPRVLTRIPA